MTQNTPTTKRRRRMAREPQATPENNLVPTSAAAAANEANPARPLTRLEQLQSLLVREGGASISEMVAATGWQQHSVRGAMAGALKKRGLTISSDKIDGVRRYHGEVAA